MTIERFYLLILAWGLSCFDLNAAVLPGAKPTINAANHKTLQAALDALPDEGGKVELPPGNFEIDQPLVLTKGDVLIEGAGTATHIINTNTNGLPAFVLKHPDGRKVATKNRLWRIKMEDLRITGNPQSGHGIVAIRINEVFLEGVTISEHGGHGIYLDYCYEDPRINDCLITYNKQSGLHLEGCHDIVVSGNQFEENKDAVQCLDGFNLAMSGNNLDDHLRHGVVIENTYGSVVGSNMIEECNEAAVVLDKDCYGITISANVIAHNGEGVRLHDAHGCAISANTFTIMRSHAIWIGKESGRITVSGNNFSDSYIGNGKVKRAEGDRAAGGIHLEATQDILIQGNLFSSIRPHAIKDGSPASKNVQIESNLLIDSTQSTHANFKEK